MGPSSNRSDNGSVTSESSSSSNLYYSTPSSSSEDEDLAEERLRAFLFGPGPTPYFEWTSERDGVRDYTRRMQPYLDDFDDFMGGRRASLPVLPPVQVFPARRRLPGEQHPFRLVDGVLATQAPRGPRRRRTSGNASASTSQRTASARDSTVSVRSMENKAHQAYHLHKIDAQTQHPLHLLTSLQHSTRWLPANHGNAKEKPSHISAPARTRSFLPFAMPRNHNNPPPAAQ
jgi:hypothetical protein